MRVALLLLLVLAIGFAVGRLTAPEGRGRGGGRGTPTVGIEPTEPASTSSAAEPPAPPAEPTVLPSEPLDTRDDVGEFEALGVITVDFEGFDGEFDASVGFRTMRGGYEEYDLTPVQGETTADYDLAPGIYDVWWQGREGRRGTRAAVEAGKRTVVRAAEIRTTPAAPDGLGILDLEVEATWGGGLSCVVTVKGRGEDDAIWTNGFGRGSAVLFPGGYVLRIGDRREEVQVVEGRATAHRIARGAEGSILLDTGNEIVDSLKIGSGKMLDHHGCWTGFVDGVYRSGFVFASQGEYDVFYVASAYDTLGAPLGRAVVHAGRTTWLRCRLPQGGLSLRVTVPESMSSQVGIVVRPTGEQAGEMMQWQSAPGREVKFTAVLAPGRYAVTASAGGCEAARAEFEVGDRMVDLALELERAR